MKNEILKDNGTPIRAAKHVKRCANNVLSPREKESFYVNARGKGIITDPNITKNLDPLLFMVCEAMIKRGVMVMECDSP